MEELLTKYSLSDILIFIVLLFFAIKEMVNASDWIRDRIKKINDKDLKAKEEHETLQEEIDDLNKLYDEKKRIDSNFEKLNKAIDRLNDRIELLTESDKEDIKAFITNENTFTKLYQFSAEQTSKISKRRKKWLCTDIDEIMNNAYNLIMEMNEGYFETDKEENISELVKQALDYLLKLEKPLLILWSVQKYKTKTMVTWSNLVCDEINLLYKMIDIHNFIEVIIVTIFNRPIFFFHLFISIYSDFCSLKFIQRNHLLS